MAESKAEERPLTGLAVVRALMGAENPKAAAQSMARTIRRAHHGFGPSNLENSGEQKATSICDLPANSSILIHGIVALIRRVTLDKPISHNMTNIVVQNFAANVTYAV